MAACSFLGTSLNVALKHFDTVMNYSQSVQSVFSWCLSLYGNGGKEKHSLWLWVRAVLSPPLSLWSNRLALRGKWQKTRKADFESITQPLWLEETYIKINKNKQNKVLYFTAFESNWFFFYMYVYRYKKKNKSLPATIMFPGSSDLPPFCLR